MTVKVASIPIESRALRGAASRKTAASHTPYSLFFRSLGRTQGVG